MTSATVMIVRGGCHRRGIRILSSSINLPNVGVEGVASGNPLVIGSRSLSWWMNDDTTMNRNYYSNNSNCYLCQKVGLTTNTNDKNNYSNEMSVRSFSSSTATDTDGSGSVSSQEEDDNNTSEMMINSSSSSTSVLKEEDYNPKLVMERLTKACQWNQGNSNRKWDYEFVRMAVDDYERHLRYILTKSSSSSSSNNNNNNTDDNNSDDDDMLLLLSSEMTECALKASLKMKVGTLELSKRVRELERLIGTIGMTPLTDNLSLALLEANGKAGNVGRAISVLQLRKQRGYKPRGTKEFRFAVQSIQSAGLYLRQSGRNIYYTNPQKKKIQRYDLDNPTRWLDAILLNMSSRNFQLTPSLANRMLDCYATTGKTGRAIHFFYQLTQKPDPKNTLDNRKKIVRMKMLAPPSYTKIPSQQIHSKQQQQQQVNPYHYMNQDNNTSLKSSKLEQEKERDWSIPLTAAFAFADSLTHGACGHDPIRLNLQSYNTLIKVCCYRGALWRAFEILEDVLPKQKLEADTYTYNTILAALARVGDAKAMREILTNMTNKNVPINAYTVEAISDGFLNVGDIAGAITLVQDSFNQHNVLPPYTTHLKILEFALANDLVFEAKRHVYFIQQLWKWDSSSSTSTVSPEFKKIMKLTQKNYKLSKVSLQRMFTYFGEELNDDDFF